MKKRDPGEFLSTLGIPNTAEEIEPDKWQIKVNEQYSDEVALYFERLKEYGFSYKSLGKTPDNQFTYFVLLLPTYSSDNK